jgi:hypothetical protein
VISLISMVSANRVVVIGWRVGGVVGSAARKRCSVIEGILTCVAVRHRRTLT